jgi:hypothetical protein
MSDGDELLAVVKREDQVIIGNIRDSKGLAGCDSCHPIKEGSIRQIELLEMVLERGIKNSEAIAKNSEAIDKNTVQGNSNAVIDRKDAIKDRSDATASAVASNNFLQYGRLKAAGVPAMIIAAVVGFMVFQYFQTEKIKTITKETITEELKLLIPPKTVTDK